MMSSFAIWMQLEEIVSVFFPERTYAFPRLVETEPIGFGPFFVRFENLVMFIVAALLTVILHAVLYHSRFGLSVRAVSENPKAAQLIGLNIGSVMFWAFALASAIGGVAAYLIAGILVVTAILVTFVDFCIPSVIYNYIFSSKNK